MPKDTSLMNVRVVGCGVTIFELIPQMPPNQGDCSLNPRSRVR